MCQLFRWQQLDPVQEETWSSLAILGKRERWPLEVREHSPHKLHLKGAKVSDVRPSGVSWAQRATWGNGGKPASKQQRVLWAIPWVQHATWWWNGKAAGKQQYIQWAVPENNEVSVLFWNLTLLQYQFKPNLRPNCNRNMLFQNQSPFIVQWLHPLCFKVFSYWCFKYKSNFAKQRSRHEWLGYEKSRD